LDKRLISKKNKENVEAIKNSEKDKINLANKNFEELEEKEIRKVAEEIFKKCHFDYVKEDLDNLCSYLGKYKGNKEIIKDVKNILVSLGMEKKSSEFILKAAKAFAKDKVVYFIKNLYNEEKNIGKTLLIDLGKIFFYTKSEKAILSSVLLLSKYKAKMAKEMSYWLSEIAEKSHDEEQFLAGLRRMFL
jgi:hypothetical protein